MQDTELSKSFQIILITNGNEGGGIVFKRLLGTGKLRVQVLAFHYETLQPT